jgi:hypothetical protein
MYNLLVAQIGEWVQAVRLFVTGGRALIGDNRAAAVHRVLVTDASMPFI